MLRLDELIRVIKQQASLGDFAKRDGCPSDASRPGGGAMSEKMKEAGVMLIIKDGLILGISRRHNKNIFGLPGGKYDPEAGDLDTMDTAIRETKEETGVIVHHTKFIYERVELGDGANPVDFYSRCYYALDWEGVPTNSEEGVVKWLTAEEVTCTAAAFGDYNRKTLDIFKGMFPDVYLRGETEIQAWHIVEILADGSKKHLATINTPDAETRAKDRVEKIKKEEGKNVFAEKFNGPVTKHCGE
jgi:8-oxo-dGTP pyrophosphatase MutT (NUDIX family)